jgi:AGCS family alanine or glycine:cation symporter
LGWCYYGEKAMEYLKGKKWMLVYRGVFIITVFVGAVVQLAVVWNLADIANALMAIPNMISLIVLSGIIAKETQKYLWNDKLDDTEEEG